MPFLRACARCDGVYSLAHCRGAMCPATAAHLKMSCREFAAIVREFEGCRTARAANLITKCDPRKSSRKPRVLPKAQEAKRKADVLHRGVQMSHVRRPCLCFSWAHACRVGEAKNSGPPHFSRTSKWSFVWAMR